MNRAWFDLAALRAAVWAERALRQTRRELRRERLSEIELAAPPGVPPGAIRGVHGLLRRRAHTCLEEALVLQRWLAAHGTYRDVVIGVTAPGDVFGAHAWLDGEPNADSGFAELTRLKPRVTA